MLTALRKLAGYLIHRENKKALLYENTGTWLDVAEHQPIEGEYFLVYSDVFGTYWVAKFNPRRGWENIENESLKHVSHFCDQPLSLPFEIRNCINYFLAEKNGFRVD